MRTNVRSCIAVVVVMGLLPGCRSTAPSAGDAAPAAGPGMRAAGFFAPAGPPLNAPVRVEAGGHCIVDLQQAYDVTGTLVGTFTIDYRIITFGPCVVPPVPGTYDEEWIAHGTFTGTAGGAAATATFSYTARVQAGGTVEGSLVCDGGLDGDLRVQGNFGDGRLAYEGVLRVR